MAGVLRNLASKQVASKIVPKAARSISTSLRAARSLARAPVVANAVGKSFAPIQQVRFSSTLKDIVERELDEERANCNVSPELQQVQEQVEEDFEVIESLGNNLVKLKRDYNGEEVVVEFEAELEQDEIEDEQQEDEDIMSLRVPFQVTVQKGNTKLAFACIAAGELYVARVTTVPVSTNGELLNYEGPEFDTLEQDMQEAFMEYLNERGVNDTLASFIIMYAELKEQREYVNFLEQTSKLVS